MIVYKTGDLLRSDCALICHQCNCLGSMGSGIAKQIREEYSEVFAPYQAYCKKYGAKMLGQILIVPCSATPSRLIVNMFSQNEYYPRTKVHTEYDKFRSCCEKIKSYVKDNYANTSLVKIGFPDHIGCGLAGGNWDVVKQILEEEFAGNEWQVEIWKL